MSAVQWIVPGRLLARPPATAAFTRTELLVMLGTVALLAALIRPVGGNAGSAAASVCMDNLRRLTLAWQLYAEDSRGEFVGNYHGGFVPALRGRERPWVTGWIDWSDHRDNTNTLYLTQSPYAHLAAYGAGETTVYRCPADRHLSPTQAAQGWRSRVRSYSMNACFGEGNQSTGPLDAATYMTVRAWSDFRRQPPQQFFVLTEEHPDSINDGALFPPSSRRYWMDLPASHHAGSCGFAFADGHLEQRIWGSLSTLLPVQFINRNGFSTPADDPDVRWVMDHSPQRQSW